MDKVLDGLKSGASAGWKWTKETLAHPHAFLIGLLVTLAIILIIQVIAGKPINVHEQYATYDDVVNRWGLTSCGAAASSAPAPVLPNNTPGVEGFARDYATVSKNWGLTACGVVDDPTAGMTDEDLVNYQTDVKLANQRGEGFATDYATVAKNWSLSPCGVVDNETADLATDEDRVNYAADVKLAALKGEGFEGVPQPPQPKSLTTAIRDAQEGFAHDFDTVSKNWGLSACGVADDATAGMTDEERVNYATDVKLAQSKESFKARFSEFPRNPLTEPFARDYATVSKNWGLSACGVVDDATAGMTDEERVNYATDVKLAASRGEGFDNRWNSTSATFAVDSEALLRNNM
jgi:shikimate kinase